MMLLLLLLLLLLLAVAVMAALAVVIVMAAVVVVNMALAVMLTLVVVEPQLEMVTLPRRGVAARRDPRSHVLRRGQYCAVLVSVVERDLGAWRAAADGYAAVIGP